MADPQLIPESIRDESTLALNDLIERMGTLDLTPLLVYLVDDAPVSVLPHLAEQFHITGDEGWLLAASDADRRTLIKNSIELHRYKGTPYAIKKVLETFNLEGRLQEWWQYDGEPYHFLVDILVTDGREINVVDVSTSLRNMILEYKNTRSQLDTITLTAVQPTGTINISAGSVCGIFATTSAYPEPTFQPPARVNLVAGSLIGITVTTPSFPEPTFQPPGSINITAASLIGITVITQPHPL